MATQSEKELHICNLVSQGMSLRAAKEKVLGVVDTESKPGIVDPKKPTAKERKESIATEIESLGGDIPPMTASVAKFHEALTSAKAIINDTATD